MGMATATAAAGSAAAAAAAISAHVSSCNNNNGGATMLSRRGLCSSSSRRLGALPLSSTRGTGRQGRWNPPPGLLPNATKSAARAQLVQQQEKEVDKEEEDDEVEAQMLRLQNGSDIRGVALEGEPGRAVTLTPQSCFHLGAAFGEWVKDRQQQQRQEQEQVRVSLGRDPRLTGPALLAATAAGLQSVGCAVLDMGLATTPACFMSTVLPGFSFDASIMLTASHLPYTRNGLKFFTKSGGLDVADIEAICTAAGRSAARQRQPPITPKQVEAADLMPAYAEHLREVIKRGVNHPSDYHQPLRGFKVVVNAGNGSGGFFAEEVLAKLGADVSASLHLQPDGMFPNHAPNPEDKAAMAATVAAVVRSGADLGVVFDTDVDRSGVVDQAGRVINGDRLIALLASLVLEEHPGGTIVTDARTSDGLSDFIHRLGGTHCLYRVGYRNVINKGVQLNEAGVDAPLMMETSGHGAMAENYFLDDGAYSAVKIVVQMVRLRLLDGGDGDGGSSSRTVGSLIADLQEPAESVELRIDILAAPQHVKRRGAEVLEAFRQFLMVQGPDLGWSLGFCGDCWVSDGCLADLDPDQDLTRDHGAPPGVDAHMYRAQVDDLGWLHLRQSIHNPNLALNLQAAQPGGCRTIARTLLHSFLLASPSVARDLDLSNLRTFVAA